MAGLGAVGGVHVGADLNLEDLNVGAVVGLEEIVEDLAALGLGIVDEQARVAAAAADGANAVEDLTRAAGVDCDGLGWSGGGLRGGGEAGEEEASECGEGEGQITSC
jgi:hypothetical protein